MRSIQQALYNLFVVRNPSYFAVVFHSDEKIATFKIGKSNKLFTNLTQHLLHWTRPLVLRWTFERGLKLSDIAFAELDVVSNSLY